MKIYSNTNNQKYFTDFPIEIYNSNEKIVKEAFSKNDFIATIMALTSFTMLPNDLKGETNIVEWVSKNGGSMQTANEIAKSVGKENPNTITQEDIGKIKEAIPYKAYWKNRDKEYHSDLNDEIIDNSLILMKKVNALLSELGIEKADVNSGWRPKTINDRTDGASKKSLHLSGSAIDIRDPSHVISKAIMKNPSILEKYNLWMEHPSATPTWTHLDIGRKPGEKPRSGRIFMP